MTEDGPVQPRDAATVILVREPEGSPWECFMVRRHVASEFAPDVYVFPGGKVDAQDRDPRLPSVVDDRPNAQTATFPDNDLSFRMAALRELFEEAGILLAVNSDGSIVRLNGEAAAKFEVYREQIHNNELSLTMLANSAGLRFAAGLLVPFSRWITPAVMPRRYDTRFYIAVLPDGQEPLHDAVETTHGLWIGPAEALRRYGEGTFPLVFATIRHLERMSRFSSVDDLLTSTNPADLEPITPKIVDRNGERAFLLPGDDGYEDADP